MTIIDDHNWDYEAILKEYEVMVIWCDKILNKNNEEVFDEKFAGWNLSWNHGCMYIGKIDKIIARKAAALFVSLWLRGFSASFANKLMSGYIMYLTNLVS